MGAGRSESTRRIGVVGVCAYEVEEIRRLYDTITPVILEGLGHTYQAGTLLTDVLEYLHRFARHCVDLFALMEVGDPARPSYVTFASEPTPGIDRSAYRRP
ncbi:hypothetical protein GCM10010361_33240 [Streptomyces olivaceiscleroticus]|uniref:Uncharacterized protein n=1 Tax=Streptomyces olivaceiscleroticus TaxID=68245 RepID=A0ABN1A3A1_9ACTN